MTLMHTLDELQRLEVAMAQLYRWLTGLYASSHPDAAASFFRLCIQEEGHASLIRYHRRLARSVTGSSERAGVVAPEVREAIDRIDRFRQGTGELPLADAIEFAIAMEDSAAERIHGIMAAEAVGGSLVESLLDEDRRHRDILVRLQESVAAEAVA